MVGIVENSERSSRKKYRPHSVTFSDNEEIINPGLLLLEPSLVPPLTFLFISPFCLHLYLFLPLFLSLSLFLTSSIALNLSLAYLPLFHSLSFLSVVSIFITHARTHARAHTHTHTHHTHTRTLFPLQRTLTRR